MFAGAVADSVCSWHGFSWDLCVCVCVCVWTQQNSTVQALIL